MKIGIIGYGYVGKAVYELLKTHYEILIYDINPDFTQKATYVNKEEINNCEMAIVCVPTPDKDKRCDTSILEETVAWLDVPLILVKSTVAPTTIYSLKKKTGKHIVFSPEYIGEGKYFLPPWKYMHPTDMRQHPFQIFGGDRGDTNKCVDIFSPVLGPDCKFLQTDSTTAELTKYMVNTWGAMKVTFVNEWFEIAKAFGADYRELRELFLMDNRVERIHTAVFPEKRGFDGKCFPKDLNAIITAAEDKNYSPELLKEVRKSNDKFRAN